MNNLIFDAVNDFKKDNYHNSADWIDWAEEKCYLHCKAMSDNNSLYHAPEEYRDWLSECCCTSSAFLPERDQIRHMIFILFASSESHRNLILNCSKFSGAYFVDDNQAWLTIRCS